MNAAAVAVKPGAARLYRAPAKDMPKPAAASAPAVPRYLRARLVVGGEHDPEEHHAERVAAKVASGQNAHQVLDAGAPHPNAPLDAIHRACSGCVDASHQVRDTGALRRAPAEAASQSANDPTDLVHATLSQPGRPIAPGVRGTLENRMGAPLDHVRVHDGPTAEASAAAIGARAYALGSNIVLGSGQSEHDTHLMAHEATHVVQHDRAAGIAMARRDAVAQTIEDCRAMRAANPCEVNKLRLVQGKAPAPTQTPPAAPTAKTKLLTDGRAKPEWEVDLTTQTKGVGGRIKVPELLLPRIGKTLKGTGGTDAPAAAAHGALPEEGKPYQRLPQPSRTERGLEAARDVWVDYVRKTYSAGLAPLLKAEIGGQKNAASLTTTGADNVYVMRRAGTTGDLKATSSEFLIVGNVTQLASNDSVVRPMLAKNGAEMEVDADHVLEDQLGGSNTIDNMWLLDRSYNRSIGTQIEHQWGKQIESVLTKAQAEQKVQASQGTELDGKLPAGVSEVRENWLVQFGTVAEGPFSGRPKDYWTKDDVGTGKHLKYYRALSEPELFQQGFKFDKTGRTRPTHINIFPTPEGGRPTRFKLTPDGKSLVNPGYLFRGIDILKIEDFNPPEPDKQNNVITKLHVEYKKKKFPGTKKKDLIKADDVVTVMHAPNLFFGGYVTRESITGMFKESDFGPASPISFSRIEISPDGELQGAGEILSSKALLPGLRIPIVLQGTDIMLRFPLPTEKLSFGPVHVTAAAIDLGVGAGGFFVQGSADIAIDKVGKGTVVARGENDNITLGGVFDLDFAFLDQTQIKVNYDLATDTFTGSGEFHVKKNTLPGVESGNVSVTVSRDSFGLTGSLQLGGLLAGGTITAGYTPQTGLVLEGKDLPLPVDKLPGVSGATATVRAMRNPQTGDWAISGGGKATLGVAGASGTLDIMVDGVGVLFKGRADVRKGPASGWLQVTATNRAVDEAGNPIEGGPVGPMKIWGDGQATVRFGKILQGTAGIKYTPDGRVILDGEVALPPDFELFPQLAYHKSLLHLATPDFPIWGVKVGPVGVGIFAFADADVSFNACVGKGMLRNTKVHATIDLDRPEEATVVGTAQFYVPAFAGFTLDLGGGLKAQVAVAYAKGRVGLDGTLGIAAEARLDVAVSWNNADGFAVGGCAKVSAQPKFELGVNASFTVGVDLGLFDIDHEFGPWEKKLGEFGPDMQLSAAIPLQWSEKGGLDLDVEKIDVKRPHLDPVALMKGAFETLV
jgi:hypothetical protein